ncbi:hypothetical protein CYJ37_23645 [Bacillus sp. UMB0728]|nr:hypothetical protein CYJ37_23645 [Bacillus sp. UMB0728]
MVAQDLLVRQVLLLHPEDRILEPKGSFGKGQEAWCCQLVLYGSHTHIHFVELNQRYRTDLLFLPMYFQDDHISNGYKKFRIPIDCYLLVAGNYVDDNYLDWEALFPYFLIVRNNLL